LLGLIKKGESFWKRIGEAYNKYRVKKLYREETDGTKRSMTQNKSYGSKICWMLQTSRDYTEKWEL
jgi:hypothetical protein